LIANFGGENISLAAVEQAVLQLDFVTDAAAVARVVDGFGEVVDLYYSVGDDQHAREQQLIRDALIGILPSHHAMGAIHKLEALPRSESGKLLRYLLTRRSCKTLNDL
jgi:acyl-coenzyme A synthetase/AMP-(fatty) acid ligase